jgi:alginate O-acetyltransferase complex protein AlgJ
MERARILSDGVLIVVFLVAICLPMADALFELDPTRLSEKRRLAPPPVSRLSQPIEVSYTGAFESWWNDSFGFRRSLVVGYSRALLALGVSSTPSVIIGRSGWLFFAGDEALASYRAVRPFTKPELTGWQERMEQRRDWLAQRGIRFLVVIAPNKETIYPEYMPARLNRVGEATRLDQLVRHMQTRSIVAIVDPREALRSAKASGVVYFRTDTHWNDAGAWVLHREILARLRRWYPELEPGPAVPLVRMSSSWSGDLATMLGLEGQLREERVLLEPPRASRTVDPGPRPPDPQRRLSAAERPITSPLRVVMFHDSFGVSLQPLLAESFSRIVFSSGPTNWRLNFDPALVERERPTVVIQEIAERFAVGSAGVRGDAAGAPGVGVVAGSGQR